MILIISIIILFALAVFTFIRQPKFGKMPERGRLEQMKRSPNFREGKFQNERYTPDLTEGATFFGILYDFLFDKSKRVKPAGRLPSAKTDLLHLSPDKDILVWFGHSSYFIQADGKRILVDPVFSGGASPLPYSVKSFGGSDVYTTEDIPEIDYLFISHDHWDHLDYATIKKIQPQVKKIITGLGTTEHLIYWGYDINTIIEKDWNEKIILEEGFEVNTLPARHFSGRAFKRQQSLWMSFALKTPTHNIFIGGDSGYDAHFLKIGNTFGPFDLAILECGQYNKNWKYIHTMPEEVVQAAIDLQAKKLLPVHWGKFALAQHDWDEPIIQVSEFGRKAGLPVLTPMIGEEVNLKDGRQVFSKWWEVL